MKTSKKAIEVFKTFSQREREAVEYIINLIEQDEIHIQKCMREMDVFENDDPKYPQAIKKQMEMQLRAKYILDCFGVRIHTDQDTGEMKIKTPKEK